MLVLAVNVNEKFCQLFHLLRSNGLPVDPANTLPSLHFPADNYGSVFLRIQIQLKQLFLHLRTIAGEHKLHQGAVRTLPQHILFKFSSQSQVHASYQ